MTKKLDTTTLMHLEAVGASLSDEQVLRDVTLTIQPGEHIAIIGPNGAGKSTLLRRMAGLMAGPGRIMLTGKALEAWGAQDRARTLAFLPQERRIAWGISVGDLVALGRLPHEESMDRLSDASLAAIQTAMHITDIAHWRDRPATALSHGEQARVLLARALATEASLILADEPVAALDPRHQIGVLNALRKQASQGTGVVVVLHELHLARAFASRIIVMNRGRIVADGPPDVVISDAVLEPVFGLSLKGMHLA